MSSGHNIHNKSEAIFYILLPKQIEPSKLQHFTLPFSKILPTPASVVHTVVRTFINRLLCLVEDI